MEINVKAIHFDATVKLQQFINKKVEKLAKYSEEIASADVNLKVVKPETSLNKEAAIKLNVPQHDDVFASKVADTFEEAVDQCCEALKRQLEKIKESK